jgi:hypothetical protein
MFPTSRLWHQFYIRNYEKGICVPTCYSVQDWLKKNKAWKFQNEWRMDSGFELKKLNSAVLVRKRTIPTERPQPVGEVSANFSW